MFLFIDLYGLNLRVELNQAFLLAINFHLLETGTSANIGFSLLAVNLIKNPHIKSLAFS